MCLQQKVSKQLKNQDYLHNFILKILNSFCCVAKELSINYLMLWRKSLKKKWALNILGNKLPESEDASLLILAIIERN